MYQECKQEDKQNKNRQLTEELNVYKAELESAQEYISELENILKK